MMIYPYPIVNDNYIGYDDKIIKFEVSGCRISTGQNGLRVS